MKLKQLENLAEKVQLKIKTQEADYLLASFREIEKRLSKFRQIKLKSDRVKFKLEKKSMISLKQLRQISQTYLVHLSQFSTIAHNAWLSPQNFLLLPKKTQLTKLTKEPKKT